VDTTQRALHLDRDRDLICPMAPDLHTYVEGWRRREREREASLHDRAARARQALPTVVALLVERFGARRVVLFGSLADGRFTESSDIDLAVEGLGDRAAEAWWEAQRLIGPRYSLDVVPIERVTQAVLRAIEAGEVLHDGR
jgi:predicted nucleotidyltransferase